MGYWKWFLNGILSMMIVLVMVSVLWVDSIIMAVLTKENIFGVSLWFHSFSPLLLLCVAGRHGAGEGGESSTFWSSGRKNWVWLEHIWDIKAWLHSDTLSRPHLLTVLLPMDQVFKHKNPWGPCLLKPHSDYRSWVRWYCNLPIISTEQITILNCI